jgi:hypothetical protein
MDDITMELLETLKAVYCGLKVTATCSSDRSAKNLACESMVWIEESLAKAGYAVQHGRLVKTSGEIYRAKIILDRITVL